MNRRQYLKTSIGTGLIISTTGCLEWLPGGNNDEEDSEQEDAEDTEGEGDESDDSESGDEQDDDQEQEEDD